MKTAILSALLLLAQQPNPWRYVTASEQSRLYAHRERVQREGVTVREWEKVRSLPACPARPRRRRWSYGISGGAAASAFPDRVPARLHPRNAGARSRAKPAACAVKLRADSHLGACSCSCPLSKLRVQMPSVESDRAGRPVWRSATLAGAQAPRLAVVATPTLAIPSISPR